MKLRVLLILLIFVFSSFSIFSQNERGLKINKIKGNEGKRWAICIGINDYQDENIGDLEKAQNDALALGKMLKEKGQFDKVITMVNDYEHYKNKLLPTKANILNTISFILEFAEENDLILFSFSGHGISDETGEGYLITVDTDINHKFDTSLKVSEIVSKFKNKNIKKTLLMLDACREEITQTKSLSSNKGLLAEKFQESEVAATFYATKAGWFSYEDTESDYGVFTRFVLEGLQGNADLNNDQVVSFSELETYVQDSVNEFSINNNRKQKPYTKIYGEKYGDLALTTFNQKEQPVRKSNGDVKGVTSFKASLKFGSEYDTAILSWVPEEGAVFDEYVILRQENSEIDFDLKDKVQYIEGEQLPGSKTIVLKVMGKDQFSFIDGGLNEGTHYYYKIFTKANNGGLPQYSTVGLSKSVKTKDNVGTIRITLDSLKVIKVLDQGDGVELYWKIEIFTSTGEEFILHEREKDRYRAFDNGKEMNFGNKVIETIILPRKEDSYFDIVVDLRDRDDIKDGWLKENQGEDTIIKKKAYRYYYNDEGIYKQQVIEESEKNAASVELKWTIKKID